jgi:hypothetical protein
MRGPRHRRRRARRAVVVYEVCSGRILDRRVQSSATIKVGPVYAGP